MAFTVEGLAQELGIPVETLTAKADVVTKYNGYLSEADTKYRQATETLEQAQREQQAINDQIKNFGITEARVTELESANAAYQAALTKAKEAGLNIDLTGIKSPVAAPAADPLKTVEQLMRSNFSNMGAAMKVQARYQSVFGKPFADDPVRLIDEATAARLPVEQYAEQKYKFGEEQERQRKVELQRQIDEGVQAGIKKYKEENPVTKSNPGLAPGVASRVGKIFKPRPAAEQKEFRNLSPRDRIAASVTRVRDAIQAGD